MNSGIQFRLVSSVSIYQIDQIKKMNSKFCTTLPYIVNIYLKGVLTVLLCDGEHIIDITKWSGIGLRYSTEVEPTDEVRELVEKYLFF